MKILITGANGFVGSNLIENFINKNYSVRCLVHKNVSARLKNIKNIELIYGDLLNINTIKNAVKNIDYIFHCAAVLRVTQHHIFYRVNQYGTKNLAETVYKYNSGIKKFVYISSQAAMGPCNNFSYKSVEDCSPVSDYGKSKLLGEKELLKYKNKFPVIILRPAAIYGPKDKDLFPFFKLAQSKLFPVLSGNNGNCFIQLLFVNDLVRICELIVEKEIKNDIYFISEEKPYNWNEIGNIISEITGKHVYKIKIPQWLTYSIAYFLEKTTKLLQNKPSLLNTDKVKELCQKYWLGNVDKAKNEFKFEFTQFKTGAKLTYEWYKKNKWL